MILAESGSGEENFSEAVDALSQYWNDFFESSNEERQEASNSFDFLFGNDVGGTVCIFTKNQALFFNQDR